METILSKVRDFTSSNGKEEEKYPDTDTDVDNENSERINNETEDETEDETINSNDKESMNDDVEQIIVNDRMKTKLQRLKRAANRGNMSYEEGLKQYMEVKKAYDIAKKKLKRKAKQKQISGPNAKIIDITQCISCRKHVGTIFTYRNNIYSAVCGGTLSSSLESCDLDIRIKRSKVQYNTKQKEEYDYELKNVQEEIIRLKLDFMFMFINETDMVNTFDGLKLRLKNINKKLKVIETTEQTNNEIFKRKFLSK